MPADWRLETQLTTIISVIFITHRHGPHRKHGSSLLLREFVSAETRLPNHSIATAVRVTSRIVTIPLLREDIT
jgi:hypothetical protein